MLKYVLEIDGRLLFGNGKARKENRTDDPHLNNNTIEHATFIPILGLNFFLGLYQTGTFKARGYASHQTAKRSSNSSRQTLQHVVWEDLVSSEIRVLSNR